MLALGTWSVLTIALWVVVNKAFSSKVRVARKGLELLGRQLQGLAREHTRIKKENASLKEALEETILLYEITKDITKTLDEEKIFQGFRQHLDKYVTLTDCKFVKADQDLSSYKNHTVLAVRLEKQTVGYLVAQGVSAKDKEKFHILASQFLLSAKRALLYERLTQLAITDGLTCVFTRRHYLARVREEIEYARKFDSMFAFLMIDVDHFKDYNDHYGHLVGDAILKEVSKAMKENLRQIDLIGRYGGEEFSIILTQTSKDGARFAAERIRQSIENRMFRAYDENLSVTISIGIAIFPDDASGLEQLIERSDSALYEAKNAGRNKVCVYKG